ncbi:MAG: 2-octaprenyl-6-methoxyphenyl hydroxylase [Methylobacter sp.]|nr:MAG: 2-octaprenyl-6-methoxyphenyl hydroxylase [Methylobacter sp.]
MQPDYDLLIAGGGLAGNCLALALKDSGLRYAVIEAQSRELTDASGDGDRALALAAGTVVMLEALGIWQGVAADATPIKAIHVSDRGHFGKTRLTAENEQVQALGYVIAARILEQHAAALVQQVGIEVLSPVRLIGAMAGTDGIHASLKSGDEALNLSARLLVGADGGSSSVRQLMQIGQRSVDYGQTAIVTTVKTTLPHRNVAYERFTDSGPLALLPLGQDCAVVWTRKTEEAGELMATRNAEFTAALQDCFGYRLGELSLAAPRRVFPLTLVRAEKLYAARTVIVGNAAHQLHPVAGQGFNLGLRDVVQLAEQLLARHRDGLDIGSTDFLERYAQAREADYQRVIGFTDQVVKLFSNDWLALAAARNFGLAVLDRLPPAKSLLIRHAMGLTERLPRLGNRT